ncbi:hypothetical protein NQ318_003672, partial [Aromia moschata]
MSKFDNISLRNIKCLILRNSKITPPSLISIAIIKKDSLQTGSVVLRIEFETDVATTTDISAYCLVLHEKLFIYNPLNKTVRQSSTAHVTIE